MKVDNLSVLITTQIVDYRVNVENVFYKRRRTGADGGGEAKGTTEMRKGMKWTSFTIYSRDLR